MASPNSSATTITLGGGSPDELGGQASDIVGLHGVRSIQVSAITSFVSGTAATTATYGTPTPDQVALGVAVNAIIVALRDKGIIAS